MQARITIAHGFPFPRDREYEGSCTVWHEVATGRRAPSHVEARLADAYAGLHPSPGETEITMDTGLWPFRRTRTFVGRGTVWRDKATGRRVGKELEYRLAQHPEARRG